MITSNIMVIPTSEDYRKGFRDCYDAIAAVYKEQTGKSFPIEVDCPTVMTVKNTD